MKGGKTRFAFAGKHLYSGGDMKRHQARKKQLRRAAAAACALVAGMAPRHAPGTPVFPEDLFPDLAEILACALEKSPRLPARQLQLEAARGNRMTQAAARWPRADLNGQLLYQMENREGLQDSPGWQDDGVVYGRFQITQPLYHWGALKARRQAGELTLRTAEEEWKQTRAGVLDETRQLYLQLALARHSLRIHHNTAELARRAAASLEKMRETGTAAPQAVLETKITAQESGERKAAARRRVAELEENLADLTGWNGVFSTLGREDFPAFKTIGDAELRRIEELISRPPETLPRLAKARHELEAEKQNRLQIESRRRPSLDLVMGAYQDRLDSAGTGDSEIRYIYYGGLHFKWNLFDGWETRGLKISSLARQRLREFQIEQTRNAIIRENRALLRNLRFSAAQLESRRQRLEMISQRLAMQERQAAQGAVSENDLLKEKIGHENARRDVFQTRVDYFSHLSRLYTNLRQDPFLMRRAAEPVR